MKKFTFYCTCLLFLLCTISCNDKKLDVSFFNGNIISVKDIPTSLTVDHQEIWLDGIDAGSIAVHDSLLFFTYWRFSDAYYSVFNLNNSQHMGYFSPKGDAPGETNGVSAIYQFYKEDGDLKTMLFAPNNYQLMEWNITKSLKENKSIYDTIVPNKWYLEHNSPYLSLFRLGKDSLIGYIPPQFENDNDIVATLPYYEKRTIYSDKRIKKYDIFKDSIDSRNKVVSPEIFFDCNDAIKPDGTKIVQAMIQLSQINIIDVKSGTVTGYRMDNSPDFSLFKTDMTDSKYYYYKVQADDNYIYALYAGISNADLNNFPEFDIIHIFDWDGNFLKKIKLSQAIREIWLDNTNNLFYGYNDITEKLYRYDFNRIVD